MSEPDRRVDVARLHDYVRNAMEHPPARLSVTGFAQSGSSNITAFLDADGEQWVLRRPPLGELRPTAHDMLREYRFITAVRPHGVPVPESVLACEDFEVLGAPFYLARRVAGAVLQSEIPAGFADPSQVTRLGRHAIETLAVIHAVPWVELDLPYRPTGGSYLERQLRRLSTQLERTPTAARLTGLPEVTGWLTAHRPGEAEVSVVHGDYGLHNMIIASPPAAAVRAVLDWEMATLGDPLADLAWFVSGWTRSQEHGDTRNPANVITRWPGAPTGRELLERYAQVSGRSISDWTFYEAFSMWKGIVVSEGLYSDFVAGQAANPAVVRFEAEIPTRVEVLRAVIGL